jgi:cell wall-associated NlpC family hydrolase
MTRAHVPRRTPRSAAVLLLGGLLASGLPSAGATPLGDAQQQASALRARVAALQVQAEIATEDYDAAYAQLGQSVTAHVTAQRALDAAQQASGASNTVIGRRVRALYMSGGTAALYARVLNSGDLTEVTERLNQVRLVLAGDQRAADSANLAIVQRAGAEKQLEKAAQESTRLQVTVAARADAVRALLAQTDGLLAAADEKVRAIAEAQQRAAEAAAAARAAAALAQAQAQPPAPAPGQLGALPHVDASPAAAAALGFAQAQLGKPYVWGATGPDSFDCSGLTGAAYAAAGVALPRTAQQQWFAGPHVSLADLQPGDLMFWASNPNDPGSIHHVALYAGQGLMVAAPHSGDVVKIQPIYLEGYVGAVRPGSRSPSR